MAGLSKEAQALLDSAREAHRAVPAAKKAALHAAIVASAATPSATAQAVEAQMAGGAAKAGLATWGLGFGAAISLAVAAISLQSSPEFSSAAAVYSPTQIQQELPQLSSLGKMKQERWVAQPATAPEPVVAAVAAKPTAKVSSRPRNLAPKAVEVAVAPKQNLLEEAKLLGKAQRSLRDGNYQAALQVLGEHETRFASGSLLEDRLAAKARVLCKLSRFEEAQQTKAQLQERFGASAHLAAVKAACAR